MKKVLYELRHDPDREIQKIIQNHPKARLLVSEFIQAEQVAVDEGDHSVSVTDDNEGEGNEKEFEKEESNNIDKVEENEVIMQDREGREEEDNEIENTLVESEENQTVLSNESEEREIHLSPPNEV